MTATVAGDKFAFLPSTATAKLGARFAHYLYACTGRGFTPIRL